MYNGLSKFIVKENSSKSRVVKAKTSRNSLNAKYQKFKTVKEDISKLNTLKSAVALMSSKNKQSTLKPVKAKNDFINNEMFKPSPKIVLDGSKNSRKTNQFSLHKTSRTSFVKPFNHLQLEEQYMKSPEAGNRPKEASARISDLTWANSSLSMQKSMQLTPNNKTMQHRKTELTPKNVSLTPKNIKTCSRVWEPKSVSKKRGPTRSSVASLAHKFKPSGSELFTPVRKSSRNHSISGVK